MQRGDDPGSPQPFVNTRYLLKGGMDTPTLRAAQLHENGVEYLDVGYRRDSGLLEEDTNGYQSFLPLELEREANGRARRSSSRQQSPGDGWSKTAFEVVGGVVGKVWEFCKKGAFRGFHAGADKGYIVSNEGNGFVEDDWVPENITTSWGNERESTPLPGQFPDEDFIPDYWDSPAPEASPQRPGKRRQISDNRDELARNWVVVQPQVSDRPSTPTKPHTRAPVGLARYSMPTASSASRRARPASRAGPALSNTPRRPLINRVSHAGHPALQSSQPASFASPRSPYSSKIPRAVASPSRTSNTKDSPSKLDSPAAKEAQKWAALKKREEVEADITMRRMDKQLKDLIRQGKEALGTKIEIEIEDDYKPVITRPSPKKWGI